MIKQSANVMNEERIEELCDLLLVRKVQSTIKGYPAFVSLYASLVSAKVYSPDTFEVHGSDFHNVPRFLALQDTISTTTRHASNIEKLGAIDERVVLTSRDAYTVCFNLKAQTALIFPQCRSDSRLHTMRRHLPSLIKALIWLTGGWWWRRRIRSHGRQRQRRLRYHLLSH